jgi:4-amino-4-deoxy-L-arabinose transferase-like glycosyltransferase
MTKMSKNVKKIKKKNDKRIKRGSWYENKYLWVIVAAGFLLRLIYVLETKDTPFFQNLFSDSKIYFDWASKIVNSGNWLGGDVFFMSPAYPYFLAFVFLIFGKSITFIRVLQVIVSSINIIIVFLTTKNLYSEKAGYIAAIIAALFSSFIFYSGAILSETLQTFVISILLLILSNKEKLFSFDSKEVKTLRRWALVGITLAVAAIFRANILLFYPALLAWMIYSFRKDKTYKPYLVRAMLFVSVGLLIPVFLITIRNFAVSGDFVLLTSNGGINFYLGNNKNAAGVFNSPSDFDFYSDLSGQKYAEKISGKKLTASETNIFWISKSIAFISSHPLDDIDLTLKKLLLFLGSNDNPQSAIMDMNFFRENYAKILKFPFPDFYFVFLLSVFGFFATWKERSEFSLFYIFICCYIISTIMFFVIGRFRIALVPILIVFAAIGVENIYVYIKSKNFKKILLPVVAIVIILLIEAFFAPHYKFNNYDAYLKLGDVAYDKHDYDLAIKYYNKSLMLKNYYMTFDHLGNAYSREKEFRAAYYNYRKAIESNPKHALSYFNLGSMYVQTGDYDKALITFKEAVKIDPDLSDAYRNMAIIYYMNEDYQNSLNYFEKYLKQSTDEQSKATVRQDINEIKRRLREQNLKNK